MIAELCERFEITGRVKEAALEAEGQTAALTYDAQQCVQRKVLGAFLDEGIDESDLAGTTGYGYDDAARARYESLLARVLGAERAIARLSIVSGTHAIVAALAACTPRGTTLLSISGRPYDTLRNAICDAPHCLAGDGIEYREVALTRGWRDRSAGGRKRTPRKRKGDRLHSAFAGLRAAAFAYRARV